MDGDPTMWRLYMERVWPAVQHVADVTPLRMFDVGTTPEEQEQYELLMRDEGTLQ